MSMPTSMKIGNLLVETPVALGPMAGVTDSAYREIAASMGCGLFTTEMVSAKALYYRNKNTELLLKRGKTEYPLGVQLFGNDPDIIAEMALSVEDRFEFIDQTEYVRYHLCSLFDACAQVGNKVCHFAQDVAQRVFENSPDGFVDIVCGFKVIGPALQR